MLYKTSLLLLLTSIMIVAKAQKTEVPGTDKIIELPPHYNLPDSLIKRIDNLFAEWNSTDKPGCAIGIIKNDSLVYMKGYGMANLEYEIPISPETIFYMASVSKQFTAYCIILLAQQGKLNLDDNISTYLPWATNFGRKITIRNLLNHTSGIREDGGLAALIGLGRDGFLTHDIALRLLKKQKALNFNPGDKYQYSNSNYVLLAEIIQSVSGKHFKAFADSAILKPLGMSHSRFEDDYEMLIENRAAPYSKKNNTYANDYQTAYTMGDGGLFSNIPDMAKWAVNFYNTKAGNKNDISMMAEKGKLNNGNEISYAAGISVREYKGWKEYSHTGGHAGYNTIISVFPDLKTGILIFSNSGDFNAFSAASKLADLFIMEPGVNVINSTPDTNTAIIKDTINVIKFIGNFISSGGTQYNFQLQNQKMYWQANGRSFLLYPAARDTFFEPEYGFRFVFSTSGKDNITLKRFNPPHGETVFTRYKTDTSQTKKQLKLYTGIYYSPELECYYGIVFKDGQLLLTNNRYGETKLKFIGKDRLQNNFWWMNHLKVTRNNKNQITGFEVNDGGIMHLQFIKISQPIK